MNISKFETNLKRKLFIQETKNIQFTKNNENEENQVINIYPCVQFQTFIGFGGALTRSYVL